MLDVLERKNFPVKELRLLASERSVGKTLTFRGEQLPVQLLTKDAFKGIDIALFSAGGDRSLEFARQPRLPGPSSSTTPVPSGWTPRSRSWYRK